MPAGWAIVAKLGLVLAILLTVIFAVRRVLARAEERQRLQDQVAELEANLARSEAARNKELQIRDAVHKVREESGPVLPDLGGVRDGPRRQDPPA